MELRERGARAPMAVLCTLLPRVQLHKMRDARHPIEVGLHALLRLNVVALVIVIDAPWHDESTCWHARTAQHVLGHQVA